VTTKKQCKNRAKDDLEGPKKLGKTKFSQDSALSFEENFSYTFVSEPGYPNTLPGAAPKVADDGRSSVVRRTMKQVTSQVDGADLAT